MSEPEPKRKGRPNSSKGKKRKNTSISLKKYFATHDHHLKGKKLPYNQVANQIKGKLKYYETHDARNKGIPHKYSTKLKISESMKEYWLQQRLNYPLRPRSKFKKCIESIKNPSLNINL